ncbi:hypothetical protein RI367_005262 [Sorochytrium milnesiophthora]
MTWRLRERIPAIAWIPHAAKHSFAVDVIAGLTLSAVVVPQSIAYALLGDLPPEVGLYTSIFPVLVFCVVGSTPVISTGPFALTSLVVGEAVAVALAAYPTLDGVRVSALVAACVGAVQMLLAVTGIGAFVARRLLPRPLVSGLVCASGAQIFASQMSAFVRLPSSGGGGSLAALPKQVAHVLAHARDWHGPSTAMGVACMGSLYALQRYNARVRRQRQQPGTPPTTTTTTTTGHSNQSASRRSCLQPPLMPDMLVVIVLATLATWLLALHDQHGVAIVGDIPSGFPPFRWPWSLLDDDHDRAAAGVDMGALLSLLAPHLAVLAVLSAVMTFSITMSFERPATGTAAASKPSLSQDLFALGLASAVGSSFRCYVSTGSLTRTVILRESGAVTPLACVVSVAVVAAAVQFAAAAFYNVPKCALAAVIMAATRTLLVDVYYQGVRLLVRTVKAWRQEQRGRLVDEEGDAGQCRRRGSTQTLLRRGVAAPPPIELTTPIPSSGDNDHYDYDDHDDDGRDDAARNSNDGNDVESVGLGDSGNGLMNRRAKDELRLHHHLLDAAAASALSSSSSSSAPESSTLAAQPQCAQPPGRITTQPPRAQAQPPLLPETCSLGPLVRDTCVWWATFLGVALLNVQWGMLISMLMSGGMVAWDALMCLAVRRASLATTSSLPE